MSIDDLTFGQFTHYKRLTASAQNKTLRICAAALLSSLTKQEVDEKDLDPFIIREYAEISLQELGKCLKQ